MSIQHGWAIGLLCVGSVAAVPAATLAETAMEAKNSTAKQKLPTDSSISADIKRIVAEQLGLRLDQVTSSASLVDLGADSLDIAEYIMALEEQFDLEIPDEACTKLMTVDDSVAYIKARVHQARVHQTKPAAHP